MVNVVDREHLTVGCVAMVNYIVANGNTTTYQWRTNKVPSRIEEVKLDFLNDEVKGENEEADEVSLFYFIYFNVKCVCMFSDS